MKENYIVPLMTVFTVSPIRALMASGGIPDYRFVNIDGISWDDEEEE